MICRDTHMICCEAKAGSCLWKWILPSLLLGADRLPPAELTAAENDARPAQGFAGSSTATGRTKAAPANTRGVR